MKFEHIKELREDLELTQEQVAQKLGVGRGAYSMWESGRDIIPLKHLNELSNIFDSSIDYLIGISNVRRYGNAKKIKNIDLTLVSNNLKKIRETKKLTQKQIAEEIGTCQSAWWNYEKGIYLITTPFVYQLAIKYRLSIDEIIGK